MDITTMIGISAKTSERVISNPLDKRVISNPLDKGREEKKRNLSFNL